jgi:hypothetical protein
MEFCRGLVTRAPITNRRQDTILPYHVRPLNCTYCGFDILCPKFALLTLEN